MNLDDFNFERWEKLTGDQLNTIAQQLASELPTLFNFVGIRPYGIGGQQNHTALYEYKGSHFALIPSNTVTLGYDPNELFHPTSEQLESWQKTVDEFRRTCSLDEYLFDVTTPIRAATIKPFLLEVTANEVGKEPTNVNSEGIITEYQVIGQTHKQTLEQIAMEGFRLPTSDEWEYACQAGSRSLFWWGNYCPADCYPTDPKCKDFFHHNPNPFGLHIAQNPFNWEFVAESNLLRGGDGGSTICGGSGFFTGWLTLASAYIDKNFTLSEDKPVGAYLRRAFSL